MTTSDPSSACPPLCQVLRCLCYSPVLFSVSESLRNLQGRSQSVLGALQIMTGVSAVGLSVLLGSYYLYRRFAILFIIFGITSILSEKFPIPFLVIFNVILNLSGVVLAILAIVLQSLITGSSWYWSSWECLAGERSWYDRWPRTTTISPEKEALLERCQEGQQVYMMLVRSVNIVKIALPTLELCLVLSSATLGIKALRRRTRDKALQIMIGVFNIGIGCVLLVTDVGSGRQMAFTKFPIWLGVLFITFGIASILSGKFSSPCLVVATVFWNLCGVAFAITAIALYSFNMVGTWSWWLSCGRNHWYHRHTATLSPDKKDSILERCHEGEQVVMMFARSINILMVVLSTLELCLVISSATLGIKALHRRQSTTNKSTQEPKLCKPLLEKVPKDPTDLSV